MDISMTQTKAKLTEPWLLEGGEAVFAAEAGELAQTYQLGVGDRPYARSLRTLYELRGVEYPPEFAALNGEVYVIVHAVGMFVSQGQPNRIDAVGYRARFTNKGTTCDLLPASKFRELATLGADAHMNVGVGVDGSLKLPAEATSLLSQFAPIPLAAEAELQVGGGATLVGNVSLKLRLQTLEIQAVGQASSEVQWQFHKTDEPLVGDQVMLQTVVVPKQSMQLEYTIQASALIDPSWFHRPVRLEVPAQKVTVELPVPT